MKKIWAFIFLMILCTGCSAHKQLSDFQNVSNAQSPAETVSLTALQTHGGVNWGASTQEGFYYINTAVRKDGSCNLMYADYNSGQTVYLCSQANCTHDSAACTSYVVPTPGGILPEKVGDKIILFYMPSPWADDIAACGRVECMDPDGSNRHTIYTFNPQEKPCTTMVTDGKLLYFKLETVQSDTSIRADLAALNIDSGELTLLQPMNAQPAEWIWGCAGNDLILYSYEEAAADTLQLLRWDFSANQKDVIYTWNSGESYPALYQSSLGYKGSDGYYHLQNLETGSDFAFTQYAPPENSFTSCILADDSNLLIREGALGESKAISVRFISLDTAGNAKDWALVEDDSNDQPFLPVATLNERQYLVYIGSGTETASSLLDDGTSQFIQVPLSRYSIMSKSDFWSSNNIQKTLNYKTNQA